VDVGTGTFLAVRGSGAPGGDAFQEAVGALYGVAFTVKMTRKHKLKVGPDYKIAPLEGLYWTADDADVFGLDALDTLSWQLLVRTPDFIMQADVDAAAETLEARGKGSSGGRVRLESFSEGRSVQMLHIGPYATEPETVAVMREYTQKAGLRFRGRHHEIYLSDPRRVPEERLRTVLRQPVG
jgi:hypothetical protein